MPHKSELALKEVPEAHIVVELARKPTTVFEEENPMKPIHSSFSDDDDGHSASLVPFSNPHSVVPL